MKNVFVYGTLRKGEVNSHLLHNATCIEEHCWTNGVLYDTGDGYPAMKQSTTSQFYGELYSVTINDLEKLDELEEFEEGSTDNLYERVEQTVYTNTGTYLAYMYVANKEVLLYKKIVNGDWKEYNL